MANESAGEARTPRRRRRQELTGRDAQALAIVADQGSIYAGDVEDLLGRLAGRHPVHPDVARVVVRRWEALRCVESGRPIAARDRMLWLTRQSVGHSSPPWWLVPHQAEVTRTRLYLEGAVRRLGLESVWVPERELQMTDDRRPDGILEVHPALTRIAIEVELSSKGVPRTTDKLLRLARGREVAGQEIDGVLFVCAAGEPLRTVRAAVVAAQLEREAPAHRLRAVVVGLPSSSRDLAVDADLAALLATPKGGMRI